MDQIVAGCGVLLLGRQGENQVTEVVFPIGEWQERYGNGTVSLVHRRPGDGRTYPVAVTVEGDTARWVVSSADTACVGNDGACELSYLTGDTVDKSHIWTTAVDESLGGGPTPPEPEQGWVDQVLEAADQVEAINQNPPKPGPNGTWLIYDPEAGEYQESDIPLPEGGGGMGYEIGHGLKVTGNTLEVDTAEEVEQDNTLPITSAAVYTTVGNIEILLGTI